MRTLALATLLLLATLAPAATAQQAGTLALAFDAPEAALAKDAPPLAIPGVATLTVDVTAVTSTHGVPVHYVVTKQPAWASVIVSPASDVFPLPMTPGLSMSVSRQVMVLVSAAPGPGVDTTDVIEIQAVTTPGILGRSIETRGATPIRFDAPDEKPCHDIDLAALAAEAEGYHAAMHAQPDEVSVQSTTATPVRTPALVAGALALVGAAVGLVLRRRFG